VIGVNPCDEPNVSESKKNTADLIEERKQKGAFSEGNAVVSNDRLKVFCPEGAGWAFDGNQDEVLDFISEFLGLARSSDYLALLPYFLPTSARDKKLEALRRAVHDRTHVATTVGYGPRRLHSTGQLHKGGPDRGVFLLFMAVASKNLPIPGEEFGFAVLQRAQALGDFRSLSQEGRRVIRIHLGSNVDRGLKQILDMLKAK
jgi:hypothetical protein